MKKIFFMQVENRAYIVSKFVIVYVLHCNLKASICYSEVHKIHILIKLNIYCPQKGSLKFLCGTKHGARVLQVNQTRALKEVTPNTRK